MELVGILLVELEKEVLQFSSVTPEPHLVMMSVCLFVCNISYVVTNLSTVRKCVKYDKYGYTEESFY